MKLLALLVHGIIVMAVLTAERKDLSQADDDSVVKCAKEDAAVLCYGKHQGFSLGSNMLESAWHGAVNLVFTKTGLEQQHNLVKDSSAKTLYGAFIAHEVMATVPAYANPIAYFRRRDPHSKSIKTAADFVARNAWILQARPEPFFYEHIAVADPAGFPLRAPGSGMSRSTNSKSPPALLIWATFIFVFIRVKRIDRFDYLIGENESGICGHSSRADVAPIRPT